MFSISLHGMSCKPGASLILPLLLGLISPTKGPERTP